MKGHARSLGRPAALLALLLATSLAPAGSAWGWDGVVQVPLGGVKQVTYRGTILRLSVGSADVAEISPMGTSEVLIKGRQIGSTSMMVWGREGGQSAYLIQVGVDLEALSTSLKELFPGEQVTLVSAGETLMLKGSVSSMEAMHSLSEWIDGIKHSLGKEGARLRVLNRLELAGSQQVQLEVRFLEVSRSAMRKLGLSLHGKYEGNTIGITGPSSESPSVEGTLATPFSDTMKLLFVSKPDLPFPFSTMISVLSSRGLAKTLSEPTLVALSGQEASFLVGGELPVPIPLGMGQVSLDWKKFGIVLDFSPFVLADQTIQLKVASTVSDIDESKTIQLSGWVVPRLISRFSSTTVRLRSGQSFAIAGLLSDKIRSKVDKVPLFGDLPVLGMLFRSTQYQREETELVVVVTASLIRPQDPNDLPGLPGEFENLDPNDFRLFLLGWLEGPEAKAGDRAARPSGRVGYR